MTDNIKPTVQEKSAWAKVPKEFNDWWNSDYSDESNPFRINSAAYWAWAGWSEAVRLNATVPDEPDWRHPKIQGLIGSEARLRIAIDLIWQILEDPNQEFTASDMEYWDTIHDKLKAALSAAPAAPQQAQPPIKAELLCVCGCEWHWENRSWELVSGPYPKPAQQPLAEKDTLLRQALEALEGFANITNDSQGVAGYHLSGNTAEWDEFDEVDAASNTIEAIRNHLGVKND